ncbi:zn 2cys6 transcription factor [Phlyctema vagabunda]|uniref:Zn 2cys6 transcription factor n=1 Tax=Phlyctema vagabunda TaxID=108571 RepID=A0ABR4PUB1_9HELO
MNGTRISASSILEASQTTMTQPYTPYGYGKACTNCVKNKTRCATSSPSSTEVGGGRGKCERCQRLNKDCHPAPSVRQKRVSKRLASATSPSSSSSSSRSAYAKRTAGLEERLDGIVQMLQQSQASVPFTSAQLQELGKHQANLSLPVADQAAIPPSLSSSRHYSSCGLKDAQSSASPEDAIYPPHNTPVTAQGVYESALKSGLHDCSRNGKHISQQSASHELPIPIVSSSGLSTAGRNFQQDSSAAGSHPAETEAELEESLETFRTKMIPYFPIVCIGSDVTVEQLRRDRPFLFLVIKGICSKNIPRQAALMCEVKEYLAKQLLIEGAKTMDLLLGNLVFLSWCHYWVCGKAIMSTITQLNMSLAFDLGLMRPLPFEPNNVLRQYIAQGNPNAINGTPPVRTMEERRTAVGLFLISSVVANYFQRIDHMRWTPYLDECLNILEATEEFSTDKLLVSLVRMQLITNKASPTIWYEIFSDSGAQLPPALYFKALQAQLNDLERSLPPDLKSNVCMRLDVLSVTIGIHDYSLETHSKFTSSDPTAILQRTESLWTCLMAIKSWFELFFNLDIFPLTSYPHISMTQFSQMAHCIVVLYRLATLEAPGLQWDRKRVRQELDLGNVLKVMTERWALVPPAAGIEMGARHTDELGEEHCADNPWTHTRRKVYGISRFWEAKLAAMAAEAAEKEKDAGEPVAENGVPNVPGVAQTEVLDFEPIEMDMLNENWIRDFLAGGYDSTLDFYM